jgi:protein SCO1/2
LIIVCLAVAASSCSRRPALPSYGVVPDFRLTDQSGREFLSSEKLNGHVWIANFIFTNCSGPCPRMTTQMKEAREKLASRDVRFVSFTIDPARDTPEVLSAYARRFHADPERWYFLTGPQSQLHQLKRQTFMLGDVDGSLQHSTRFVLVDAQSRIRGFYDSSDAESMGRLPADALGLAQGA